VHTGTTNNSPKSIIAACARAGALRTARAGIGNRSASRSAPPAQRLNSLAPSERVRVHARARSTALSRRTRRTIDRWTTRPRIASTFSRDRRRVRSPWIRRARVWRAGTAHLSLRVRISSAGRFL